MSAAKHTRTPWESHGKLIIGDGGLVATVGFRLDAEEQAANVALIKAAPELLRELEHAVRWFDQLKPTDVVRYRAVIAKATGTSHD